MKNSLEKCPMCFGKGEIKSCGNSLSAQVKQREKIVKDLRRRNYTFQEIMMIVGYKSPNSITKILNK